MNEKSLGDQCTLMFAHARLDNTKSIVMNYKTMTMTILMNLGKIGMCSSLVLY